MCAGWFSGMRIGPVEEEPSLAGNSVSHLADLALKSPSEICLTNQTGGGRAPPAGASCGRALATATKHTIIYFIVFF